MDDVRTMLALLALRKPFCFAHFNDGEVQAATRHSGTTDHGWQSLSQHLASTMTLALRASHPRLYIGLPCKLEFGGEARRRAASLLAGGSASQFTTATVRDPPTPCQSRVPRSTRSPHAAAGTGPPRALAPRRPSSTATTRWSAKRCCGCYEAACTSS